MESTFGAGAENTQVKNNDRIAALRQKVNMSGGRGQTTPVVKPSLNNKPNTENNEVLVDIELDRLIANPYQPRLAMDQNTIRELALSIKERGQLQPIVISDNLDGTYTIRYGHRRTEAMRVLNRNTIKAVIKREHADDKVLFAEAFVENLEREGMHAIDIALSLKSALDKKLYSSYEELGKAIAKDKSQVSRLLSILSLPETILADIVKNRTISDRVVLDNLRKVEDEKKCAEIYDWYCDTRPTRDEAIDRIKQVLDGTLASFSYSIKQNKKGCVVKLPAISEAQSKELKSFIEKLLGEV